VRAGANSAVGTLAQLVFLPTAYIFGWLSQTYTVFQAAWVIVIITATAMIIFCLKVLPMKQTFAVDKKDINEATSHINR
jgi:low affinity Fe/Cu permease